MKHLTAILAFCTFAACDSMDVQNTPQAIETTRSSAMELGAFSVSLAVKDLQASRAFYEELGFTDVKGDASTGWLVLRNGNTTIGLFQGMFENNIMTFNPGWTKDAEPLGDFTDIRQLQQQLKSAGVKFMSEADEETKGPASFMLTDPDGNVILFDQHV